MQHRFFLSLGIPIFLLLVACSGGPPASLGEKYLSDARNDLKTSDFNAAVQDLDAAIKSAGGEPIGLQAATLRVVLVTTLADTAKQLAEAYAVDGRHAIGDESAQQAEWQPDAHRDQFPGFTGGVDPTVTKIKTGQWIPDADRVAAETRLSRNALARILSALAGAPQDPSKGQQLFSSDKVDIDIGVFRNRPCPATRLRFPGLWTARVRQLLLSVADLKIVRAEIHLQPA